MLKLDDQTRTARSPSLKIPKAQSENKSETRTAKTCRSVKDLGTVWTY